MRPTSILGNVKITAEQGTALYLDSRFIETFIHPMEIALHAHVRRGGGGRWHEEGATLRIPTLLLACVEAFCWIWGTCGELKGT